MKVRSFRDLIAWQRSVDFIDEVYRLTRQFPDDERFALTAQLRAASISVAANIAEGSGRFTSRDYLNFPSQSRGSIKEAESHVLVAQRLGFATGEHWAKPLALADEISRLLFGLRESIRSHGRKAGS